ncbi:VanZ family protein [Streptomyces millisiae]|uniref:VanZ family protein n=1 Tax=Streptomyces millisiae TaxID=3075542 RepID=UPI00374E029A
MPTPTSAPSPGERTPFLQRDSWGASLARTVVLFVALVCMVAFAVALARVTLVPSPASTEMIHTNLEPGSSIRAYLDQPDRFSILQQVGGNVLLGMPFGVLLPMLFPRIRGLLRVPAFTALVMVLVEIAQGLIVEGRAFDVDDVILNTTGALVGYVLAGRRLGHALHPRRHHWWHRWTRRDTPPQAMTVTDDDRPSPASAAAAGPATEKKPAAKKPARKAATEKTAMKKTTAKKTATKKTAAKKAVTKKTAAKKTTAKKAAPRRQGTTDPGTTAG